MRIPLPYVQRVLGKAFFRRLPVAGVFCGEVPLELSSLQAASCSGSMGNLRRFQTHAIDGREQTMLGIIMAGGLSRRLGRDKVRLAVHGEGMPDMLERTGQLLARHTDDVLVSARTGRDAGPYRLIPDLVEGLGPFGGIYSVLHATREPLLVLSCDLPFMDDATLETLLQARAARPPHALMTTFLQEETGFIEALVAVYEPACLPYFEAARAEDERKLSRVIPPALRAQVPYGAAEALPFFNVNYPADFELARRLLELARCGTQGGLHALMRQATAPA